MKTNGRKLLTDSLSEEDEKSNHHFNKKQQLKRLKRQPCKVHPKLSSSSSGSNESEVTSPPYRHVLNYKRSNSLTSSTELYAEVYRTSSGAPAMLGRSITVNALQHPQFKSPKYVSAISGIPILKRILSSEFAIMFNVMFFFSFQTGSASIYGGSDLPSSKSDKYNKELSKLTPLPVRSSPTRARKSETTDIFWKGFAIFLLVTFILAIIVSLTAYFIYRSNWL